MLTKNEIDTWFNDNYTFLNNYTKNYIHKYNRSYDPTILIGDLYLFINNREIKTYDDLLKLGQYFIKQNIKWTNSNVNAYEAKHTLDKVDISEHINIKNDIYDYDSIIDSFTITLNKNEQRVWDICWNKCYDTKTKLAEYLNISTSNAAKTIKEFIHIQNKLREYVKEYINNIT